MRASRALGAAVLSAAIVAGMTGPAAAAAMRTSHTGPLGVARADDAPTACTALATQIVSQVTGAATGLLAVPPNVGEVTGLVGQLIGDVTALQSSGCLPAIPPAPGAPSACVAPLAQLLSDLFGLLADLTATPPNVTGAVSELTHVQSDLASLISGKCLPAVPLPGIPGLPVPVPPVPAPLPLPGV